MACTKEFIMILKWRPHRFSSQLWWLGMLALVTLWITLLGGCTGFGGSNPSLTGPAVTELDNEFSPRVLHIKVEQAVTWVNKGQTIHTVTADDHSFDSGNMDTGAQYTRTFKQPGHYAYFCRIHGASGGVGMAGVIIVDGPSSMLDATIRANSSPPAVLRVPEDYATVQAAV